MKKKHRVKVKRNTKEFCLGLIGRIRQITNTLLDFNVDIRSSLPSIFLSEEVNIECVYSTDREHCLFILSNSIKANFNFSIIEGDVFNYLDESGAWNKMPVAIRVENSSINLSSIHISGVKPFEIVGNNIEIYFNNLFIDIPYKGTTSLEYGFVVSYSVLLERLKALDDMARDIVKGYSEYFNKYGKQFKRNSNKVNNFNEYLYNLKIQMEKYFFDETVDEYVIDTFIKENQIILEQCLSLEQIKFQVELKDITGKYGQNLKPDLIGFNTLKKLWTIVDYKKVKRTILKNTGKVRTSFKADVFNLQAQLKDYREYFNEDAHRKCFFDSSGFYIESPITIGIIGLVDKSDIKDFNKLCQDLPRWFDIISYNHLYDRFCRFVDTVNKLA